MAKSKFVALPGIPYPLGATPDGEGVNFSIFSEHAIGATLCLFGGSGGNDEIARLPLFERTEHIWHAYVPGARAGQRYGYRMSGPYDPRGRASLQRRQAADRSVCARARSDASSGTIR